MSVKRISLGSVFVLLWGLAPASSQDSLIEQEIDSVVTQSRWQLGPFRLTPTLAINTGYDSNAISSPEFAVGDFRASLGPGLVAAVPLGYRGVFEVHQQVNFVYYHRFENLRDINNATRLGGAFGGKNLVVRFTNHYRNETTRPSSEFDIPLRQRSNDFGAEADVALGWRHLLTFGFNNYIVRIQDSFPSIDGTGVDQRLNRNESAFSLAVSRSMTEKTTALFRGFYRTLDFVNNIEQRDGWAYGLEGGFTFAPEENVNGQLVLGYKRMDPEFATQPSFKGLIASVNTSVRLNDRFQIGSLYSRDVSPSIIENNWFFVQNRYGASFTVSITETVSIGVGATFGRNTYPNPVILEVEGEEEEKVIVDRFDRYSLTLGLRVTEGLSLSISGMYDGRQSDIRLFEKDRFLFNFGINASFL